MTMKHLLGLQPSATAISQFIHSLEEAVKASKPSNPEVKSYSDAVYFNYYTLGISLLFVPKNEYKLKAGLQVNELQLGNLVLDGIDIYNIPKSNADDFKSSRSELTFMTFPISPIILPITAQTTDKDENLIKRPSQLDVTLESSGKDFVGALGEPDRKGGGAGPSSGSINIWCEWTRDGVMVEFCGAKAKGPNAWDTGKDAAWKVITLFKPGMKRE